jgi:hypothetical protein
MVAVWFSGTAKARRVVPQGHWVGSISSKWVTIALFMMGGGEDFTR